MRRGDLSRVFTDSRRNKNGAAIVAFAKDSKRQMCALNMVY
jgi:hypothetical protein